MNGIYYGSENLLTLLLLFAGVIIVSWAQANISMKYSKYKKKSNKSKKTGAEVAREILDKNNLSNIYVVETSGNLTDHYDPTRKVIKLSTDIYHGESIASISVAAHEVGHAIQDKEDYRPMRLRSSLVPIVNLVTRIGYIVMLISLIFGALGYFKIGIVITLATLIFQLVTLPVEFDASSRAKKELLDLKIINSSEEEDVSSMLKAAALTYVASFISSLFSLLRLIIMSNRRRD